jgi:lipopolysaccharide/colanic/teichoic acid biosynthesis glycosyltransferase
MSSYRGKRALDLIGVALLALPASLVAAICVACVRLTSAGPVIFVQERAGRDGKPFMMLKFRTMFQGDNPLFPDNDRITRVGRWLRRLSLDELPQMWNVVRGDMSLVGPRPALPYQVGRYDQRQRQRLAALPGLTGLAQVRGRNRLTWAERIELDLEYVAYQSLWLDSKILIWTLGAVLGGSGVEGHPVDDPIAAP